MRKLYSVFLSIFAAATMAMAVTACSKGPSAQKNPSIPPDQVVTKFFELISEGGKLTNLEALKMVSSKYGEVNAENFRRWTENYSKDTSFKVKETVIQKEPNSRGDLVAMVRLDVQSPSQFGGTFTTTSQINLILDEKANEWKIDFMADTIDEESYRNLPAEAKATN